jgi:Gpi18-like mannosyltransferase
MFKLKSQTSFLSKPIFWIFVGAIFIRLILIPFGNNIDMLSHAGWGQKLYFEGPKQFYYNTDWVYSWPTQPPILVLLLGGLYNAYHWGLSVLNFINRLIPPFPSKLVMWYEASMYRETVFPTVYLWWMKLPAILSDLALGMLIYLAGLRFNKKAAILSTAIFLLVPFSWYISAVWGQVESFLTILGALAFIMLHKRWFVLASLLFFISIYTKPLFVIFLPFFIFVYLLKRPSVLSVILSAIAVLTAFLVTTMPFTDQNPFVFAAKLIPEKILNKGEPKLTLAAWNFWNLFFGQVPKNHMTRFLGIPAFYIGVGFLSIFYGIAGWIYAKRKDLTSMMVSLFIIMAAGFLFMTNMLDRYLFPAFFFLLFIAARKPQILFASFLFSIFYFFNLFGSWWYPQTFFAFYGDLIKWNGWFVTRIFSFFTLLLFFHLVVWLVFDKSLVGILLDRRWRKFFPKRI